MSKRAFQLPAGVRYLTRAELDARRADKAAKRAEGKVAAVARDGFSLGDLFGRLPRPRRRKGRRRRPPVGLFRPPR